ncbi:MAG: DegV family EDD domain-containing protein [Streptosporangiales bacterium]|nr:DegV family EDD domain-containing protein [Streptosporangiales bacterium]
MSAPVALVTDSTAYLPVDLVSRYDLSVVPLQVVIGGRVREEGVHVGSSDVAEALRSWIPVTTSRPSPERFAQAYQAAAEAGAAAIVSMHLSGQLSGTVEAASFAAEDAPVPVRVVDSGSVGMGLGLAVLAAARAAVAAGADVEAVAEAGAAQAARTRSIFCVDTLEHLRRGGRIGPAAQLVGSALMVKPLLHVVDGHIAPLEKVRTMSRAIARLTELAEETAGDAETEVVVHHLAAPERADQLAARIRERLPKLRELRIVEVGAVIGAHAGPGMIGTVVAPV